MNTDCKYYNTTDENFSKAIELYENKLSHDNLIQLLKSGKVVDKQIATLKLETLKSQKDAQILIDNLTGQDGKVREAVSFKLKEFMKDENLLKYFSNPQYCQVFFNATLDINGNICRNTICAIKNLKSNKEFCEKFLKLACSMTMQVLNKLETFTPQTGKYIINKELFKLYWCLEDIYEFIDIIHTNDVKSLLIRCSEVEEYTIREKVAKILTKNFEDKELQELKEKLKNDENYYVRRI